MGSDIGQVGFIGFRIASLSQINHLYPNVASLGFTFGYSFEDPSGDRFPMTNLLPRIDTTPPVSA